MLHPHTELRFVSPEIGYGIFATQRIPKGTITWSLDELDRIITKEEVENFSEANKENLIHYTYRDYKGNYIFCWDLTRYINHSFTPNSLITPLGFEVAIRDIEIGDEITNDYGTLNILEPFRCAKDPNHSREWVRPDDIGRYHIEWDAQIKDAFKEIQNHAQPLYKFLTEMQKSQIHQICEKRMEIPSILNNLCRGI